MEIRGGAGGDEAALFAYELYRMYLYYCERHRLKVEEVDKNEAIKNMPKGKKRRSKYCNPKLTIASTPPIFCVTTAKAPASK